MNEYRLAREKIMNAIIMGDKLIIATHRKTIRAIITEKNFEEVREGRGGSYRSKSIWRSPSGFKMGMTWTHDPEGEHILKLLRDYYRHRIPLSVVDKAEQYE